MKTVTSPTNASNNTAAFVLVAPTAGWLCVTVTTGAPCQLAVDKESRCRRCRCRWLRWEDRLLLQHHSPSSHWRTYCGWIMASAHTTSSKRGSVGGGRWGSPDPFLSIIFTEGKISYKIPHSLERAPHRSHWLLLGCMSTLTAGGLGKRASNISASIVGEGIFPGG